MPYWFIRPIAWVVFHLIYLLFGGIRFEGRENVPKKGGILITPNHISDADPPTVAIALPRDAWVMAKEEIFSMKIIGPFSRWLHGFPVKRYTADRAALRRAEELLKQGEAVIIFPEGKLSQNGQIQPLLPGVLLIAKSADVSIVPTVIIGTERIIPYGSTTPRPSGKRTIVRFGPPVTVAELTGGGKGSAAMHRGAERLRELMLAVQRGEPYPEMPPIPAPTPRMKAETPQPEQDTDATQPEQTEDAPSDRKEENGTDAQRIVPKRERPLVLVAEDMGLQVRLMRLHLERAGYDVIAVADGVQALERCAADLPDLIMLDVEMPGLNGFQVLDKLRSSDTTRHIPIIMLTAHAKDAPLFAEWAEAADLFLTKPFTPATMVADVKRVLAMRSSGSSVSPAGTAQTNPLSG